MRLIGREGVGGIAQRGRCLISMIALFMLVSSLDAAVSFYVWQ